MDHTKIIQKQGKNSSLSRSETSVNYVTVVHPASCRPFLAAPVEAAHPGLEPDARVVPMDLVTVEDRLARGHSPVLSFLLFFFFCQRSLCNVRLCPDGIF